MNDDIDLHYMVSTDLLLYPSWRNYDPDKLRGSSTTSNILGLKSIGGAYSKAVFYGTYRDIKVCYE